MQSAEYQLRDLYGKQVFGSVLPMEDISVIAERLNLKYDIQTLANGLPVYIFAGKPVNLYISVHPESV